AEATKGEEAFAPGVPAAPLPAGLRRLSNNKRQKPLWPPGEGRRDPANTAAGNENGLSRGGRGHRRQRLLSRWAATCSARSGAREASLLRCTRRRISSISRVRSAVFRGSSMRVCARARQGRLARDQRGPDLVK